jgi:predicted ATPase
MKRQRMHGTLALRRGERDEAERCFRHAIEIAQARAELSLELRAAMSVARLWASEGRAEEARQLLGGVHGWFTEGFTTAELRQAHALMDAIGGQRALTGP